jgi:hypothetical protein
MLVVLLVVPWIIVNIFHEKNYIDKRGVLEDVL